MKISHRLWLLTGVASLGLVLVGSVGTYSVTAIQKNLKELSQRATPLHATFLRLESQAEKSVSSLLHMAQARTPDQIETENLALSESLAELQRLTERAHSFGATPTVNIPALTAFGERFSALSGSRLNAETEFRNTSQALRQALQSIEGNVKATAEQVNALSRTALSEAVKAQQSTGKMIRLQRDAVAAQTLLKDALVILYAIDSAKSRYMLTPLRERLTAVQDSLRKVLNRNDHKTLLNTKSVSEGVFKQLTDQKDGVFSLKGLALSDDRTAQRGLRAAGRKIRKAIDGEIGHLEILVDDLEIDIVKQRFVIDQALNLAANPDSYATSISELIEKLADLGAGVRNLLVATTIAQVKTTQQEQSLMLGDIRTHIGLLRNQINEAGHDALLGGLNSAGDTIGSLAGDFDKLYASKAAAIAARAETATVLDEMAAMTATRREADASAIASVSDSKQTVSDRADAEVSTALILIIGIAAVAVLILGAFSFAANRFITRRLDQAVNLAEQVANGRMDQIDYKDVGDEISALLGALNRMVSMLSEAVLRIRNATDSVNTGVSEISSGNGDLSHRTTRQASSLEITSKEVDLVARTAASGADAAREAAEMSQQARAIAEEGVEVMRRANKSMTDVRVGADEINNIITVIDGIAFQTNILALNAAVEAARAGEQGRGFAVVAAEVRGLASKSAAAAKQIAEIISSNVSQVERGSTLVNEAGQKMENIVSGVSGIVEQIQKISDGSVEQANSITNVNDSIRQLEEMTQQNAALAEEISAAAEGLVGQTDELNEAVEVFNNKNATPLYRSDDESGLPVSVDDAHDPDDANAFENAIWNDQSQTSRESALA